jgi:adenine deaminase
VEDLLADGHIDHMIRRAVAAGLNPIHAIKLATINTARYFGLHHLGAVAPGWMASLAVVEDLANFRVRQTYLAGRLVAEDGVAFDPEVERRRPQVLRSSMNVHWLEPDQFAIRTGGAGFQPAADGRDARPTLLPVHVIKVLENRIDTGRCIEQVAVQDGELRADPQRDLCKVIVIERHRASGRMGKGFVRGFGMREGAIASTVAHDSHNMVVVGVDDADLFAAALHLVKRGGGFCVVRGGQVLADVPLPVAGLMSDADAATLKQQLERLHDAAGALGIQLRRPFMAMSFLTLSVIGALKITDQGLIDVERFQRIDLIAGR